MTVTCFLGIDLAWREDRADLPANETGVAAIDPAGRVLDARLDSRRRAHPGLGRGGGGRRQRAHVRGRAAGGDQQGRPAAVRDPGRAAVRPLEGERQPDQHPLAPAGRGPVPEPGAVVRVAVLRRPRRAAGGRAPPVGVLPVHHAGRRGGTRLRPAAPPLQAPAAGPPGGRVAARARRELRHADRPAGRARGRRPAAAAGFAPGHPPAGRGTVTRERRRVQAPRGPDRRAAMRLDRVAVGASRAAPMPGSRPGAVRRRGPAATIIAPARPEQRREPLQ